MYTRKITVALALLLVCLVVLVSASYAWLTMSLRPEVNGIETNIGANGSLEIALLDGDTFIDPSLIRTKPGDSAVERDPTVSNLSWGNVVDLSDERYGLGQISMYPARLNLAMTGDGVWSAENNILVYAEYGGDGRISDLYDETVSGVFLDERFRFSMSGQEYGVRGIGVAEGLKPQQTALLEAQVSIPTYANSAKRMVQAAWQKYGDGLMDVLYKRYCLGYTDIYGEGRAYTPEDRANVRGMLEMTIQAYDYVDAMIRQYLIGYAATIVEDSSQFRTVAQLIQNTEDLLQLRHNYDLETILPEATLALENHSFLIYHRTVMEDAIGVLDSENGNSYWDAIAYSVEALIDAKDCYLNELSMGEAEAYRGMSMDNTLRVGYDSGAFSQICQYIGGYSVFCEWDDNAGITVEASADPKFYPKAFSELFESYLADKKPAGGYNITSGSIRDVYGFAVDLAFRCNEQANLLLQTDAEIRIDNGSQGELLQGGGSSMKFTSEQLETDRMVMLMDGIRIAFLDVKGEVLALAKLNTSNYEESKDGVSAPLYLYEFQVSDSGVISLGERREKNSAILELPQNTASVLTAVVWLDGDSVDNSFASTTGMSITGSLNLQFSTDAELVASSQYADGT